MASIVLPKPGSQYGPCKKDGDHIDCARTRSDAALLCPYCKAALGYERFVTDAGDGLAHETCAFIHFRKEVRKEHGRESR